MKKDTFEQIINDLKSRVETCTTYFENIHTTDDIKQLPLVKVIELRDYCRLEYDNMTKIAMVDLYHIIGMGDLTVIQTNSFLKLFRQYMVYRPVVKAIKNGLVDFDCLPSIPVKTKFKLIELARGLELTAGPEDCINEIEEFEDVNTYTATKPVKIIEKLDTQVVSFVNDTTITGELTEANVKDLNKYLLQIGFNGLHASTLEQKIKKGGNYGGVAWTSSNGKFIGIAATDSSKDYFRKAYAASLLS